MCGKDTIKIERKECPFSLYHPITGMKCLFFGKHFSCVFFLYSLFVAFLFVLPFIVHFFTCPCMYILKSILNAFSMHFFSTKESFDIIPHTHIYYKEANRSFSPWRSVGSVDRSIDRSIELKMLHFLFIEVRP